MAEAELYIEDVEIGDDIPTVYREFTSEEVTEFVSFDWGASGGVRPSRFTDLATAHAEGLPGMIVPGSMNIAVMSQILTGWSPSVRLKKLDVVFRKMVPHNAPIRLRGIVTDKIVSDGESSLDCDVFMEDEDGTPLIIGRAVVELPSREQASDGADGAT